MVSTPARSSPSGNARARRVLPFGRAAMARLGKTAGVTAEGGAEGSGDADEGPANEDSAVAGVCDIIGSGMTAAIAETRMASAGTALCSATIKDGSGVGKRMPPAALTDTPSGPGLALATCVARSKFGPGVDGTNMETAVAAGGTSKAVGLGPAGVAAFLGCCGCGLASKVVAAVGTRSAGAARGSTDISVANTRSETGWSSSVGRCAVFSASSDGVRAGNGG